MTRFLSLLVFVALFATCNNGPEGVAVEAKDAVDAATEVVNEVVPSVLFAIDPTASTISWAGTKVIGSDEHTGTIPVTKGKVMVAEGNIVAGKFVMDMGQMVNTDMPAADGGDKLIGHLKSADFFNVEKHPTAMFEISKVEAVSGMEGISHKITGNLTLKGVSKSVSIPAMVSVDGGTLKAETPAFTINRMDWDVSYGNGSIADLAKDKVISDNLGLKLSLVAKK